MTTGNVEMLTDLSDSHKRPTRVPTTGLIFLDLIGFYKNCQGFVMPTG